MVSRMARPTTRSNFFPEMKRWFDHYLRGEKNGIEKESPVTIHVQNSREGNAWRHEGEWPIARAKAHTLFLGANGKLGPSADREEQGENYRADPTIGAAAGLWDPMALGVGLPQDQTDDDLKSLAFTTEPLTEDIEISGAPEAVIHAAITEGDDANLVAKLCDVDPDGGSALITTGWLKASHRSSLARREKLQNGEAYEFKIPLWSTSYRVPKGHSIRLSVSCSDFPHLWPDSRKPELRVFFGGKRASSISLPAIPASKEKLRGMEIRPPAAPPPPSAMRPIWKIERDLAAGAVSVSTGMTNRIPLPQGGTMNIDHCVVAKVSEARPDTASVGGDTTMTIDLHHVGCIKVHTRKLRHADRIDADRARHDGRQTDFRKALDAVTGGGYLRLLHLAEGKLGGLLAHPLLGFLVAETAAREVGPDYRDWVAKIIDIAERIGAARVSHQAEQIDRQGARDFQRHREILIFFLAEPRDIVGDVDAGAGRIGAIRAAAMIDGTGVEEHRALGHLRGDAVLLAKLQLVLEVVAARNDARGAVLFGEVGHRP